MTLVQIKWAFIILAIAAQSGCVSVAPTDEPYLYILGVAQDAGYPQIGCYKPHCTPAWKDARLRKNAVSLGLVDPALKQKYLFEATPNLPQQLYQLDLVAPVELYGQVHGVFLTHAHIGHYAGLMYFGHEAMSASNVPVFAMPKMQQFLESNGPWEQLLAYNNILIKPLVEGKTRIHGRFKVTPFLVPHRDEYSETAGFRIDGPNKSAVFIPDINKWSAWQTNLPELVQSVDYAFLDATFYNDTELPGRDMSKIPHPFVVDTMARLSGLSPEQRKKVWFIHMNHTSPLLDPHSEASRRVRAQGFNVAEEGQRLVL